MWRSRMFWRVFLTYGLLLLGSIAVLEAVVTGRVEQHYLRQVEDTLHTRAVLVRETVAGRPGETGAARQRRVADLGQESATRITLLAADGTVLADSDYDPAEMENH